MAKPFVVYAFLAVAGLFSQVARAESPPNVWDIAVDPQLRDRWTLHARVTAMRFYSNPIELPPAQRGAIKLKHDRIDLPLARGILEAAHAASSPDTRLRFDLGEMYEESQRHASAISVLKVALAEEPDHPAAERAWAALASAYAHLGATEREREAHEGFLARCIDASDRATGLLNLAEAEMRAGELDEAVAHYHASMLEAAASALSLDTKTHVLAEWGLAVAHDRRGDSASAYREAKRALENDAGATLVGADPSVYFMPAYERNWYLALGATVYAREGILWTAPLLYSRMTMQGDDRRFVPVPITGKPGFEGDLSLGAARWERVEALWQKYLAGAADDHTRPTWQERAKEHLAEAQREKRRARGAKIGESEGN